MAKWQFGHTQVIYTQKNFFLKCPSKLPFSHAHTQTQMQTETEWYRMYLRENAIPVMHTRPLLNKKLDKLLEQEIIILVIELVD